MNKNRKGVTLVELMIVLALLSVVLMIAFSVLSFGFKGFNAQTDNIDNQSKVRLALSDISKEIRKTEDVLEIDVYVNEIDVDGIIYKLQGSTLMKDGSKLVSGIKLFKPSMEGKKVTLEIISQAKRGREFKLISEIYLRE